MKPQLIYLLWAVLSLPLLVEAQEERESQFNQEFELELKSEYRYFFQSGQFEGQKDHFPSIAIQPQYTIDWNESLESINFTGFFRLDRDRARTHWDIREWYYQKAHHTWELSVGLKKIFWGVAESNHLVDIINQTDQVESFDGQEKLGQAMVQFTWVFDRLGTFDFFYLPHHRKRTFAGTYGRLRFADVIDANELDYESGAGAWRQDLALRWSHYFGIVDIGLSHFYGNGREPLFAFDTEGTIIAFYPVIHQSGLDLQVTHDAFLWKLESIYRYAEDQDFVALAAGVEYTFSNIRESGIDFGLLTEYSYDGRDEWALSALENDLFFGSRLTFNDVQDTNILFGGILDLNSSSKVFSVEASRRVGSNWKAEIEARIFNQIDNRELLLSNFRADSFIRMSLSRFF
ncbi:MAG: hypothetical protein AAF985_16190 [Bacteroidota bacterium]